jgi:hypothetical protein
LIDGRRRSHGGRDCDALPGVRRSPRGDQGPDHAAPTLDRARCAFAAAARVADRCGRPISATLRVRSGSKQRPSDTDDDHGEPPADEDDCRSGAMQHRGTSAVGDGKLLLQRSRHDHSPSLIRGIDGRRPAGHKRVDVAASWPSCSSGFILGIAGRHCAGWTAARCSSPSTSRRFSTAASNGEFNIIGWVGFHITSETANGSSGTLLGYFTRYIAQGLAASASSPNGGAFGVHVITLVE